MDPSARPPSPPRCWQTLLLGLGFLALYSLLARDTLHAPDAARFIQQAHDHDLNEHHHFLYNRLTCALAAKLAPLGISAFETLRGISVVSGALAVAFSHRAFLRAGLDAAPATVASLLVGTCPALVYYATTVEIHALHLAVTALAFWSIAGLAGPGHQPTFPRILLAATRTGVLTGVAATVHATGHLSIGLVALPLLRQRRAALTVAVLVATHAIASRSIAALASAGVAEAQTNFLAGFLSPPSIEEIGRTLWQEWLVALAPVAWLGLIAAARGHLAPVARCLHLAFVPHLALTVLLLRAQLDDHGSYVLPFAVPLGWLTTRMLRPSSGCGLAAIGLAIAWAALPPTDDLAYQRRFAAELIGLENERHVRVIGVTAEVHAAAREATTVPTDNVLVLHGLRQQPVEFLPTLAAAFDQQVRSHIATGRTTLLTERGAAWLRSAPGDLLARLYSEHIANRYRLEPVDRGTLRGWLLHAKP